MSTEDAKAYLSSREVPSLFECLMTGLMFHRPNDHIQYLIECLEKVKTKGQAAMTWNMFVEVRSAKTPLPPITPDNGKRPASRGRTPKEEVRAVTPAKKTTPLPPIASSGVPNVPIVFIMGGPGCGKEVQASKLVDKHPGWVNINLGELLRAEVKARAGDAKWEVVKEAVCQGELAPEDVALNCITEVMKKNTEANGFVIQGYPRDSGQAMEFEQQLSRVDAVFLLDCEEEKLTSQVLSRSNTSGRPDDSPTALARRMANYKEKTLPVLKSYDDAGKLYIIDGDQDPETTHDELSIIFETLLQNMENGRIPSPPSHSRPTSSRRSRHSPPCISPAPPKEAEESITLPEMTFYPPPEIKVPDSGRKEGLPQAPIIFLAGGPGSGKGTQCGKMMARYPEIVHLSMGDILRTEISMKGSADEKWGMITKLLSSGEMAPTDVTEELLIASMKANPNAKAYLVEGYPRDALQYEDFNRNIGGHSFTILLDCEAKYLNDRLMIRGGGGTNRIDDNPAAITKKMSFFTRNTLPLLKAIDDERKLITVLIDGDRDEDEIFYDIVKCLDFSLYGIELTDAKKADDGAADDACDKEAVVEEVMTAQTADTTGEADVANPAYTAELDALEKPAAEAEPEQGQETAEVEAPAVEAAEASQCEEKEEPQEAETEATAETDVTVETEAAEQAQTEEPASVEATVAQEEVVAETEAVVAEEGSESAAPAEQTEEIKTEAVVEEAPAAEVPAEVPAEPSVEAEQQEASEPVIEADKEEPEQKEDAPEEEAGEVKVEETKVEEGGEAEQAQAEPPSEAPAEETAAAPDTEAPAVEDSVGTTEAAEESAGTTEALAVEEKKEEGGEEEKKEEVAAPAEAPAEQTPEQTPEQAPE